MYGRPPISTLFPYPTLFRSHKKAGGPADAVRGVARERLVLEHTAAELDLRRWRRGRCGRGLRLRAARGCGALRYTRTAGARLAAFARSEEHTSELQSQSNLVCRLLLEKKKKHKRKSMTA